MPITFGKNQTSLSAIRMLEATRLEQSALLERLSTGSRLNRASDDPAATLLASGLELDTRVFTTAIRNVNDGIGLLNIAESALGEMTSIVSRVLELAEQSANGIYTYQQRRAMNTEAQALVNEYNRIISSTEYNDYALLSGNLRTSLQVGYGTSDTLSFSIGDNLLRNVGSGTFQTGISNTGTHPQDMELVDLNNDGNLDMVGLFNVNLMWIWLGTGDGRFTSGSSYTLAGQAAGDAFASGDFNGDGNADIASYEVAGGIQIRLGNGNGTLRAPTTVATGVSPHLSSFDVNGDGRSDIISSGATGIQVFLSQGGGTFSGPTTLSTASSSEVSSIDYNSDGILDITAIDNGVLKVWAGSTSGTFSPILTLSPAT